MIIVSVNSTRNRARNSGFLSKIRIFGYFFEQKRRIRMAVTLTDKAARHVSRFLEKRGKGIGLRFGVQTSGCSGMAYKLEYVDESEPGDVVFESNGIKVFIDEKSLPYVDGTELDYAREGLSEGFRFSNPNIMDTCGCGSSFRTEHSSTDFPPGEGHGKSHGSGH
jgi:iron-sulfur cluster assembly protein